MGRKTSRITYSLHDRGRVHTGQDRSNVDVAAMVRTINSPKVQELVNTGSMLGYYGHQIRQRFGMWPPETAIINGQTIRLEPSIRTVELSADHDGTVTHVEEFLENDAGEHALKQYKARIGGFSVASNYRQHGNTLIPSDFAGFDYVVQPNFVGNAGVGLYDGIGEDMLHVVSPYLEREIAAIYDSIHREVALGRVAERSIDRVAELERENYELRRKQRERAARQQERQQEIYDSLLCPAKPFDPEAAKAFLQARVESVDDRSRAGGEDDSMFQKAMNGLGKLLGGK